MKIMKAWALHKNDLDGSNRKPKKNSRNVVHSVLRETRELIDYLRVICLLTVAYDQYLYACDLFRRR